MRNQHALAASAGPVSFSELCQVERLITLDEGHWPRMNKAPWREGALNFVLPVTRPDIAGARFVSEGDARIAQEYSA